MDTARQLKNTFARYPTGVTVVSVFDPARGGPIGITVNSYTSVSLEPPLILWCIDKHSSVFETFVAAPHYAVSVLRAGQDNLSNRFATPGQHGFEAGEGQAMSSGAVLLTGRLAGMHCKVVDRHEAGDHVILVGEVLHADYEIGTPLVYCGRKYIEGIEIAE